MKRILYSLLLLTSLGTFAQVGIGTTTPAATTDITAQNPTGGATNVDGLLIPRVDRQRARNMAGTPTSTLIYVNNLTSTQTGQAANIDAVGFYYYDGAVWQKLNSGGVASNDWTILGNANTTMGTNFIGTTNAQGVDFRTNNTNRFRIPNANQVHAMSNGTATLPFYSWDTDSDIGMYRIAANTLGFATGATERFKLSNTEAVFNDASNNYDFRIESDSDANLFMADASTNAIGINGIPTTSYTYGAIVHNIFYPLEVGSDAGSGYQASIGYYSSNDVRIDTERDFYGYVGVNTRAWYRMYSYGFINTSRKETKRNFIPINGNNSVEDYVMNTIDKVQPYFYKYKNETDQLDINNFTKYRPMMHIGLLVEESPDYLKDETFSGIDIYGLSSLAIAGVKANREEIKKIKNQQKTLSDFGTIINLKSGEYFVDFETEFTNQTIGNNVIISLTLNDFDAKAIVSKKTERGFYIKILSPNNNSVNIDWVAMAKVNIENNDLSENLNIPSDLKNQLEISDEVKQTIKNLHKNATKASLNKTEK